MKKIFVLIVFMAVVINANAQYIADGHHMTYRGVSFAGKPSGVSPEVECQETGVHPQRP